MPKVRVNFFISEDNYKQVQDMARNELTTCADIFRSAIKQYIYNYRQDDINAFFEYQKKVKSNIKEGVGDERTRKEINV